MIAKAQKFAILYAAESARLTRQIGRKTRCSATACDLVQDLFLRIWERASDPFMPDAAYLTRSARNAAIDQDRGEARRKRFIAGFLPEQYAPPPPTPFDIVSMREDLCSVEDAIAALPDRTRHIFLLNRIHGRSFSEIASVMGISERAVAKHMARAMAACEAIPNR